MINCNFPEALVALKAGKKIVNPNGDTLFLEGDKVMCIPYKQYPNGRRIELKVYWDAILSDNWCIRNTD